MITYHISHITVINKEHKHYFKTRISRYVLPNTSHVVLKSAACVSKYFFCMSALCYFEFYLPVITWN